MTELKTSEVMKHLSFDFYRRKLRIKPHYGVVNTDHAEK